MDNNFGIAKKEKMDKNYVTEGVSSLCGLEENIDLGNLYRRKLHLYHKDELVVNLKAYATRKAAFRFPQASQHALLIREGNHLLRNSNIR